MFEYVTVDVFTETRFGGNPLAVILDARGIADEYLQLIAREFNYSETTFVYPPDDPSNHARVRIFTPTDEIPFAGHPNVGTAFVLGRLKTLFGRPIGDQMVFEEEAGLVKVALLRDDGGVVGARIVSPKALEIGADIDLDVIANCVSLTAREVMIATHLPRVVSVGLPIVVIELTTMEALAAARPDTAAFAKAGTRYWHRGDRFSTYLYVRTGNSIDHLRTRMFAPLSNIPEDPATGSAAAALGAYLAALDPRADMDCAISIEQGVEMGRRSIIGIDVQKRGGVVDLVQISGRCVPLMNGRLTL